MNDKRRKGAVGIKQIVVIGVLVVAGLALTLMYNRHIQKERLEAERQAEWARLKRERAEEAARAQRQKEEEEAEKKRRAEQEAREKAQREREEAEREQARKAAEEEAARQKKIETENKRREVYNTARDLFKSALYMEEEAPPSEKILSAKAGSKFWYEGSYPVPKRGRDFCVAAKNSVALYKTLLDLGTKSGGARCRLTLRSDNGKTDILLGEIGFGDILPRRAIEEDIGKLIGRKASSSIPENSKVEKPTFKRTVVLYNGNGIKKEIDVTKVPRTFTFPPPPKEPEYNRQRYYRHSDNRAAAQKREEWAKKKEFARRKWKALYDEALRQVEGEATSAAQSLASALAVLDRHDPDKRETQLRVALADLKKLAERYPDNADIRAALGRLRYAIEAHRRMKERHRSAP